MDISKYLAKYVGMLEGIADYVVTGRVAEASGIVVKAKVFKVKIGELCKIELKKRKDYRLAEVVGIKDSGIYLMPFDGIEGISIGDEVIACGRMFNYEVSDGIIGRVLDGLGNPIDRRGDINCVETERCYLNKASINPLERKNINDIFETGIKAIDAVLTCGIGQRMGIFSAAGVGKSSLLGMIARNSKSDVNVIALIGERGREAKEFIENHLREDGVKKSVVIVSTSDTNALVRLKSVFVANGVAEYFANKGKKVLLLIDSMSRLARAQREIGLAIGEPPSRYGYTPSVFSLLPKIVERAGNYNNGSITAFYTVLVEGNDPDEPISDEMRSLLDGHIILSKELANENYYPAIDILQSVSRVMDGIINDEHRELVNKLRKTLAIYEKNKDAILIGAYKNGSNEEIDYAINKIQLIKDFLKQKSSEYYDFKCSIEHLAKIFKD